MGRAADGGSALSPVASGGLMATGIRCGHDDAVERMSNGQCRHNPPKLQVYLLGQISVDDALYLQRRLAYEASGAPGRMAALLLCEHPPAITIGRAGSRAYIGPDDETLRRRGIVIRWVNRGGGCWFHMPGQLVAYSIYPLTAMDLGAYRRGLVEALRGVLCELQVDALEFQRSGYVYSAGHLIAGWGVAVHRRIATHGFWINVSLSPDRFRILQLKPLNPMKATTIEARRTKPTPMARVREAVVRHFCGALKMDDYFVSAGDHLLNVRLHGDATVTARRT